LQELYLVDRHSQVLKSCIELGIELVQSGGVAKELNWGISNNSFHLYCVPLRDLDPDIADSVLQEELLKLILDLAFKIQQSTLSEWLIDVVPDAAAESWMQRSFALLGPSQMPIL